MNNFLAVSIIILILFESINLKLLLYEVGESSLKFILVQKKALEDHWVNEFGCVLHLEAKQVFELIFGCLNVE